MANAAFIQTNFTGGEISPKLQSRNDLKKYFNGVADLSNAIIYPHGGASKRPGTRYVSGAKDNAKQVRLIPFQFSVTQAYVLEFGDQYIRFYKDEGIIESAPSVPYEISSPWTEAQLDDLWYFQSADILYVLHPDVAPKQVNRTGHTSWTITDVDFLDGPYYEENVTAGKTLQPSGTTGSITITASGFSPFASTDVGRLIRIKHGSTWGYAKITGYTSATVVSATVKSNFGATTASISWRLGVFSATTGFPSVGTFHEQRMVLAGTNSTPQGYWLSNTGDFYNFAPSAVDGTVTDIRSIYGTLQSNEVNPITFVASKKQLVIGTKDSEFIIAPSSSNASLSPTNFTAPLHSNYGSKKVIPVIAQNSLIFVQEFGRKVFEYKYDFQQDNYDGNEISLFSEHLFDSPIREMCFAKEPYGVFYFAKEDGTLTSLTYLVQQEVIAAQKIELGGEDVFVESICSIRGPNSNYNQIWLCVKRTINGSTKRYIEFLEEEYAPSDSSDKDNFFLVDCGLTYDGPSASTISGLDHLIGQTVSVLGDGAVQPDAVVNGSGEITLSRSVTKAQIGLPYAFYLKTLVYDFAQVPQTTLSVKKRIYKLALRLYNSLGGEYGWQDSDLYPFIFRSTSDVMDSSPPLFTGLKEELFPQGYDELPAAIISHSQPLPITILSIVAKMSFDQL